MVLESPERLRCRSLTILNMWVSGTALQKRRKLLWKHALPFSCHKEHQSQKAEDPRHQGTGVLFAREQQPPSRRQESSGAWACPGMGLLMYFLQHHTLQSVPGIQQRSELWAPRQSSNYPAMWDLHGITLFPPEFAAASSHRPHIGEEGKKVPAWKGRGGVDQEDPGAGYLWSSYSVSRRSLQ